MADDAKQTHEDRAATSNETDETRSPEELQALVAQLREETQNLEQAVAELKANEDRLRRTAAFYENRRRQMERELEEARKYGIERLVKKLLPVKDGLERAVEAAKESGATPDAIREGVEMVIKQFDSALESEGVVAVASVGEPFDPNLHEALAQHPTNEVPPNHVISEFQRGYMLNDRLLRAASVLVAAPVADTDEQDEPTEIEGTE